jgi:MtN3 and saliva related transmembrane protein
MLPSLGPAAIEAVGTCAALLTTLCWLPQAVRTIRLRETHAISLWTQAAFFLGLALWLAYGLLIASWPLVAANAVSMVLVGIILVLKIRYG